jgi:RNA polymerase sigma factor (TIGR02999 family)
MSPPRSSLSPAAFRLLHGSHTVAAFPPSVACSPSGRIAALPASDTVLDERNANPGAMTAPGGNPPPDGTVPQAGTLSREPAAPSDTQPRTRPPGSPDLRSLPEPKDLSRLLAAWNDGDGAALSALIDIVYEDLRDIAHRHLREERTGHTLNTTALVHEAYLHMADRTAPEWQGRPQFFALVSRVMRHVLIDYARRRNADKRGGGSIHVPLGEALATEEAGFVELLAVDQALTRLAERDERLARVVECRFFGGLKDAEIAETLGISERTVARDWKRARAYLYQMLGQAVHEQD